MPSIRFSTFSTIASFKSITACFGLLKASNILPPNSLSTSVMLPVTTPIPASIVFNLAAPCSLSVKNCLNAANANNNAPIPVAAIPPFIVVNIALAIGITLAKAAFIPPILTPITLKFCAASVAALLVSSVFFFTSSKPLSASLVSALSFITCSIFSAICLKLSRYN